MSRQSKAAKRKLIAQQFTALRKAGDKGPSKTKPAHGKIRVEWRERQNKVRQEAEALRISEEQKKRKEAKQAAKSASEAPSGKKSHANKAA